MAACMTRLGVYCQAPPRSSISIWRQISIQPSFRRDESCCGRRGLHGTAYKYAKSARKRPLSAIVAPSTQNAKPKPKLVIPKQSPLRPTRTSDAAPTTHTPTSAVRPTDTMVLRETKPTRELLPSDTTQPAVRSIRNPMPYRSPYDNILAALEQRNMDISLTEKNSSRLSAALASSRDPMLLYQSPGQKQFTVVSYSATMFMFWAGFQNFSMYSALAAADSWSLWFVSIAGNTASIFFVAMGVFFATGPWKIIQSITAIPSVPASNSRPQLNLRLEFVQIVPLVKFTPLELPASSILRMHSMSDKVKYLEKARALETRRSNVGDGFFDRVRLLLQDFKKLFDRRHYFGYLRIRGGNRLKSGTWKMDLSEAHIAHHGKTLDVLLIEDWDPPQWRIMAGHTNTLKS